jgi:hypothetical protein
MPNTNEKRREETENFINRRRIKGKGLRRKESPCCPATVGATKAALKSHCRNGKDEGGKRMKFILHPSSFILVPPVGRRGK